MCCRRTARSSPNSPARSVSQRRCSTPPRRFMTRPRRKAMPTKMSAPCMRCWRAAPAFDTGKLNMKSAGYGAPVEWHQGWAFYPHTNDDLAVVGIMLDDIDRENGPMLVVPGSHKGPVYDHHGRDGRFCGAIDPQRGDLDFSRAMPCLGKAGSVTVHHVRAVHGSATNLSGRERRFL